MHTHMYVMVIHIKVHYRQRRSRIFPRHRDGVLIHFAIHRRSIVIAVIAGPRVYRDCVKYRDRITNVYLWYKLTEEKNMKSIFKK